jgi:hypothetical protein
MLLNPRGTNGSGKTTVATSLVNPKESERLVLFKTRTKAGRPKDVIGYRSAENVILVGRYDTACGGCDGISTQDEIVRAIDAAYALSPRAIVYEGLLISGLYGRYLELARRYESGGRPHVMAFLDTPLEVCIERTRARTQKPPTWDPSNVQSKHRAVRRCRERAIADGLRVVDLPHGDPVTAAREVLFDGGLERWRARAE